MILYIYVFGTYRREMDVRSEIEIGFTAMPATYPSRHVWRLTKALRAPL